MNLPSISFSEFLTPAELDDEFKNRKDKAKLFEVGVSAKGHHILGARMGRGDKTVLLFGFPHPNEPIGSLTVLVLIDYLNTHPDLLQRYTWYLIPCADPDGAELNKGWFKGPFSIRKHSYNFYRSPPAEQTNWSFPVVHKGYAFNYSPPHVKALTQLIDRIKPSLLFPLHNADFGGAYFLSTKDLGHHFYEAIVSLCNKLKIPLNMGEPEESFMREIKKPLYREFTFQDYYEHFSAAGKNPKELLDHGTNSIGYAQVINPDVFGFIAEVPYLCDDALFDQHHSKQSRRDCLTEQYNHYFEVVHVIEQTLMQNKINSKSEFYHLMKKVIFHGKQSAEAGLASLKDKSYDAFATKAEEFSAFVLAKFYYCRVLGELHRLLKDSPGVEASFLHKTEKMIDSFIADIEKHSKYSLVPIERLVQLQLGCILLSVENLHQKL